ncbi:hypothetical protein [uncultured Sulfitobacter sp.]|jgi:hypothetical protein|uniref:hypothetical protein n=1 Tax=Sulfitobacter sp. SH22 TaxID=3421172 RepID=UPI0025E51030|nr:hypothetical protein [uncultured Sulfitobacter sp.]
MTKTQKRALALNFLSHNDLQLQHAVLLLGGARALWRLQRLRQSLATSAQFTSGHRRGLNWLDGLLSLELIEPVDPMEFMSIDPDDPAVYEICLLSEACGQVIKRLGKPGDAVAAAGGQQDAA